ncbi:MAG: hypothetical protein HS116_02250 [Planctomycetes bacterium]|nr:hypothetical protein [Planctomycetota bacterium]
MAEPGRIPPNREDRNAARARALRAALNRALQGFGELVRRRDMADLASDQRRKAILAREITELLERLDEPANQTAFAQPLGQAYQEGWSGETLGAPPVDVDLSVSLDKDRIKALADGFTATAKQGLANTKSVLPFIESKVLNQAEREKLREAAIEATARGLTTLQFAKMLKAPGMPVAARAFTEDGRLWITVTGQRRIPADLYAETLARTLTYHAANRGALDRAEAAGVETVMVPVNPGSIDFCLDLEGKVYALTEAAAAKWGVPLLSRTPNGGPPWHPNCRHTMAPFTPRRADAGKLPEVPEDVLTREAGKDARSKAQDAFLARLKRDPKRYAEVLAESTARRGFGSRSVRLKGRDKSLAGKEIPGIVGRKEYFGAAGEGALAEDVHLYKRMKDSGIVSRKEYRERIADTLRAGAADPDRQAVVGSQNRLAYYDPATRWMAIVEPSEGQAVTAFPLKPGEWELDFKRARR